MFSSSVIVRDWHRGRRIKIYDIDKAMMSKAGLDVKEDVIGCYIKISRSDCLVGFEVNSQFFISSKKKTILINDRELEIKGEVSWPYLETLISHPELNLRFKEFAPMETLKMKIDPTYDWIDFSYNFFAAYLLDKKILD